MTDTPEPDPAAAPATSTRTIHVDYLARVEGEAALDVRIRGDRVERVELRIFEPPRLFEALLRGRAAAEAPDLTARICGICPVAYQMSAVHAVEAALGVQVGGALRDLRRLLYCGEWIESHALHVLMLHAPDFLGYPDVVHMAKDHPERVKAGLALKKAGNAIVALLGGREIHPINVRLGGFYRAPARAELRTLVPQLEAAREVAADLVRWVATFTFPDVERDVELVALRHPTEYPMNEGRLVSTRGLDIGPEDFEATFAEEHVRHTHALQSRRRGGGRYVVGPLARFALNYDRLSSVARDAARDAGLEPSCRNPFRTIVVRAVEVLHAVDEALRLVAAYEPPPRPAVDVPLRAAVGQAWTEAPRGVLYHRYALDAEGTILEARIVPPTSQNQAAIEEDLAALVQARLAEDEARLTALCEQAIRNYDPCISCATHFLRLNLERVP